MRSASMASVSATVLSCCAAAVAQDPVTVTLTVASIDVLHSPRTGTFVRIGGNVHVAEPATCPCWRPAPPR